ncbi:MAG: hypothetical protein HYX67_14530 [Candidatus Melainabacteria bacterium]|nr:hypothetical protein [Candidatus Melainabacteria bacterium]
MKFGFKSKTNSESVNTLTIKDKKFKINSAVFGATLGYYERWMNLPDPQPQQKQESNDWKNLRWTFRIESKFVDYVEEDKSGDPYPDATQAEKFERSLTDPFYQAYLVRGANENRDIAYDWEPSVSSENILLDQMPAPYNLLGATLKVPGYDKQRQAHLFTMYVFEHAALEKNNIEFLERDGDNFRIRWKAKCAVEWDKKYGKNLDFDMDCWIKFCGILVIADSREEADKLVSTRLDLTKLPLVEKVEAEEVAAIGISTQAGYRYSI